jgi:hypothetical protein
MASFPHNVTMDKLTSSVFETCYQVLTEQIRDETPLPHRTIDNPNGGSIAIGDPEEQDRQINAAIQDLGVWRDYALDGDPSVIAKWNPYDVFKDLHVKNLANVDSDMRGTVKDLPQNWYGGEAPDRAQDYLESTSQLLDSFCIKDYESSTALSVYRIGQLTQAARNVALGFKYDLYNLARRASAGLDKLDRSGSPADTESLKVTGMIVAAFVAAAGAVVPGLGEAEVSGLALAGNVLSAGSTLLDTGAAIQKLNAHPLPSDPYDGWTPQEIMRSLANSTRTVAEKYWSACDSIGRWLDEAWREIGETVWSQMRRPRES